MRPPVRLSADGAEVAFVAALPKRSVKRLNMLREWLADPIVTSLAPPAKQATP